MSLKMPFVIFPISESTDTTNNNDDDSQQTYYDYIGSIRQIY